MFRNVYSIVFSAVALVCVALSVEAAEHSSDFFHGNWAINTDGKCGLADAEHMYFRANGTFENRRGDKAEGVGFWRLEGDQLTFEMLTSPGFFYDLHKELKALKGLFGHYTMRALTFNKKADYFEAVATLGDQMKKVTAVRCK